MKYLTFFFLFFFLCCGLSAWSTGIKEFSQHFKLIPYPQRIELTSGKGIAYNSIKSIFLSGTFSKPVLYGSLKSLPLTDKAGAGVLVITLSNDKSLPESTEGYVLEVKNDQVMLRAKDEAGLFYGCQTLLQLLEDAHDQSIPIPACRITDYPDIAFRAIHVNLKHHLDAGQYYYNVIDRLAQIKINAIIVEFEDKLRYRKAPLVGASNSISIEEFAAISKYAKDRHIEISPLVQGVGHASFILKHEEYGSSID